jgi:hypothetical protein
VFGRIEEQPDRGSGPREGLILLLFTILTVAVSAYVLLRSEDDALHDPAQKAARGEIDGLEPLSLLREANLRKALAKVEAGPRPLISSIRVAPSRVDVTVRDNDGSRKILSIDAAFGVDESNFGVGDDTAVRTAQIDASAPERMVKAVAERTRLGADAVDYVTLSFAGNGDRNWYMALDKGPAGTRQWIAAVDGTDLRKPGVLSQVHKDAAAKRKREFEAQQRRFKRQSERRNACLQKAQDAVAAGRCIERFPL